MSAGLLTLMSMSAVRSLRTPDPKSEPNPPDRANHLPVVDLPELVPARMINEILYCKRLMVLEWTQREFTDNAFTVEGRAVHQRVDQPDAGLKAPGAGVNSAAAPERPYSARSVWLSSERL